MPCSRTSGRVQGHQGHRKVYQGYGQHSQGHGKDYQDHGQGCQSHGQGHQGHHHQPYTRYKFLLFESPKSSLSHHEFFQF